MIHTDSDEGPVPVEVLQFQAAKAKDAENAALRARLESVEAARRDAQESRFALIVQNEELGAELAATRARLENAEAALRFYAHAGYSDVADDDGSRARVALGAAGERSEG